MTIKGLVDLDFLNYKKASMFIIMPFCSLKCDRECGKPICQNSTLVKAPVIEVSKDRLIQRYLENTASKAIVFGGLEPLDSFEELIEFIDEFRKQCNDDIVIYTGYNEDEIVDKINILKDYNNIIIKYGRFIPDQEKHYDAVLGVKLASPNQYAKKIS